MTMRSFTTPSAIATVMIRAVFKAGQSLLRDFGEVGHLQASPKGLEGFVAVANQKAEKVLREHLQKARPDFGFQQEESQTTNPEEFTWIVDPLNGALNFQLGIPYFVISIALKRGNNFKRVRV